MCICECVHERVCACASVCMCECVHERVCACASVCMSECVYLRVCACVRGTCVRVCITLLRRTKSVKEHARVHPSHQIKLDRYT